MGTLEDIRENVEDLKQALANFLDIVDECVKEIEEYYYQLPTEDGNDTNS